MTEYLDDLDAAADWTPVTDDAPLPAMTLPAYCEKRRAWERGDMSDEEWAEYRRLIHEHPRSWLNWMKAMSIRGNHEND